MPKRLIRNFGKETPLSLSREARVPAAQLSFEQNSLQEVVLRMSSPSPTQTYGLQRSCLEELHNAEAIPFGHHQED